MDIINGLGKLVDGRKNNAPVKPLKIKEEKNDSFIHDYITYFKLLYIRSVF